MLILTIRTDKPEAELALYEDETQLAAKTWHAHRQLAETIHATIDELLQSQEKSLHDIKGIVAYQGPGSFTGLRIGLSVTNALAYSLAIPAVAATGSTWQVDGIRDLLGGKSSEVLLPEYGADVHITVQKK